MLSGGVQVVNRVCKWGLHQRYYLSYQAYMQL